MPPFSIVEEVCLFARDYINVKSFRTSLRKQKIRQAYEIITGKKIIISCSTCYVEALLEITNKIKMATRKGYELKRGVLLQAFGDASKACTNDTLTDELAEWYLKYYPEKAIYFSKIPVPVQPVGVTPPQVKVEPPKIDWVGESARVMSDVFKPPVEKPIVKKPKRTAKNKR